MKLILGLITIFSTQAFAYCDGLQSKVDNHDIYAEVNRSRSHLEMDLVMVSKNQAYYSNKIRITGGKGYSATSVPTCDSTDTTEVKWLNDHIATHDTHDFDSWQATYRICVYNVRNELKASYSICNFNTGD